MPAPAPPNPFDLFGTYLELAGDGSARPIEVTESFWPDLMSGRRTIDGRLMIAARVQQDMAHWEMHPLGEEIFYLLSGEIDVILDRSEQHERIALGPDAPCTIVPRATWHRFEVRAPGTLLIITHGEGTQTRSR